MGITYLYQINSVVLNNAGAGQCSVAPSTGQYWMPTLTKVNTSIQGSATRPYCAVFQGATGQTGNAQFIDDTQQGDSDTSSMISGTVTQYGEAIIAKWTGGNPGDTATLIVIGTISDVPPAAGSYPQVPGVHFSGHAQFQMSQLASLIAQQIQTNGVPAIDHPAAVNILFGQAIASGADYVSPRLNVGQYQSLVGVFFAQENTGTAGTEPYYRLRFDWSLQADGYDPLVREDWVPAVGPFSFTSNYRNDYVSPCYGDTLTVTAHNYDNQQINLTWGIFGSYRSRTRSFLRGRYPDDLSNAGNGLGSDNILMMAKNQAVASNGAITVGNIQMFEGPVTVSGDFTPSAGTLTAGQVFIQIQPQPFQELGNKFTIYNDTQGVITPTSQIILPRRTCTLEIHNHFTSQITANVTVTGLVQPS